MNNNRSRSHTIFSCYVLVLGLTLVGYANADDDAEELVTIIGAIEAGWEQADGTPSRALDTLSRAARTKALTIWWSIT